MTSSHFDVFKGQYIYIVLYFFFYAFSTPFPKNVGLFEALSGLILLLIFSKYVLQRIMSFDPFSILVIITFLAGFVGAIVNANESRDFVRDIFPHAAYFIVALILRPVSIVGKLLDIDRNALTSIMIILFLWMFAFSLRSLFGFETLEVGKFNMIGNHLTQSPLFFATALFAFCYFFHELPKFSILSVLALTAAAVALFCYAVAVLRGPTIMFFIALALSYCLPLNPRKILVNGVTLVILMFVLYLILYNSFLSHALDAIIYKSETYGVTSKDREFLMVIDYWLAGSSFNHIFGFGFGALWPGPFGEYSFTHNILSYYIIKLGFLGIIFVASIYFVVFVSAIRIVGIKNKHLRNAAICLALSILFSANFESSFKAVDFAICIFILQLLARGSVSSRRTLESNS